MHPMITANLLQQKTKEELIDLLLSQQEKSRHTINYLHEQIRLLKQQRFGRKSERDTTSSQLELNLFDEAETAVADVKTTDVEVADESITVASHTRAKTGRKPLPKDLPRIQVIHDLADDERTCACGCELSLIGEVVTEQLEYTPAKAEVIEHIQKKYACKGCEDTIKQAAKPAQPIPKSIATPSLLANIIVGKYQDHCPLYRQEAIFQRAGIDVSRATLAHWMIKCGVLLKPLYLALKANFGNYDIAFADETTVQVLDEPGRDPSNKSYIWLFGGGPPNQLSWVYHYAPGRAHDIPLAILDGFKGYLHCDGFGAYNTLANKNPDIIQVGCWYHVRRKFMDAKKASGKAGLAQHAINVIKRLSDIERNIVTKKLNPLQTNHQREHLAKPIIAEFKIWLDKHKQTTPNESLIGKAINYTINQWEKLQVYLTDHRLEFSNNRTERGIKPFTVGRKNWLFSQSVSGIESSAILYSLLETCKAHKVEPLHYFSTVLRELPLRTAAGNHIIDDLLPFTIDRKLVG